MLLAEQIVVDPEIEPGFAGIELTVTASVCTADEPQALFAVTEMVPPVEPAVAGMLLVAEDPDQPGGNDQV